MSATTEATKHLAAAPVIIDLGKKKRSVIKQLCNGQGVLVEEVNACVEELKASGAIAASAQPVILVIREKRKPAQLLWPGM
jgi:hypothetical protein